MKRESLEKKFDRLYERMGSIDTQEEFDACLQEVMTTLEREDSVSFFESIRFEKKPLLSKSEMQRLLAYEKIISASLGQMANVWEASCERATSIRQLQLRIGAGSSYSRNEVEALWQAAAESLPAAVQAIKKTDLKSAVKIVMEASYTYNVIEAHELPFLRETPLRDGLLDIWLVGMSALWTHLGESMACSQQASEAVRSRARRHSD